MFKGYSNVLVLLMLHKKIVMILKHCGSSCSGNNIVTREDSTLRNGCLLLRFDGTKWSAANTKTFAAQLAPPRRSYSSNRRDSIQGALCATRRLAEAVDVQQLCLLDRR